MLSNNGLCLWAAVQYIFLVQFNNSDQFQIHRVTRSYSSPPFLCALVSVQECMMMSFFIAEGEDVSMHSCFECTMFQVFPTMCKQYLQFCITTSVGQILVCLTFKVVHHHNWIKWQGIKIRPAVTNFIARESSRNVITLCSTAWVGNVQWNPSITDTIGTQHFIHYSKVSLTQGLLVYFQ